MDISVSSTCRRMFRLIDFFFMQCAYFVDSRFKYMKLGIPENKERAVVLSFDVETWGNKCGGREEPSSDFEDEYFRYLPRLLNVLDDYSVRAHFFVCGRVLELYPAIFKEVLTKGHGLGGHGYSHERMHTLSGEEQRGIVKKVGSLLNQELGVTLNSWRCPGLAANRETYRILSECDVRISSNAPRGRPILIDGVLEVPIARKMDGQILGYDRVRRNHDPREWADYMKKKFENMQEEILVLGMHTWVQRKHDPECDQLIDFLEYLEPCRNDVWLGSLDDMIVAKSD